MPDIDIFKYNIDNYTKFDPSTIKPNTTIIICGPSISGKSTLEIDLVYKIKAHHEFILHTQPSGSPYSIKRNEKIKKKYNKLLPLCNHHTIPYHNFRQSSDTIVNTAVDNILSNITGPIDNHKNVFLFNNIDGISRRSRINSLKNLTKYNYFINKLVTYYNYHTYDVITQIGDNIDEYDYIFLFNSYDNNFSIRQLQKTMARTIGHNMGLCSEIPVVDSLRALLSTVNINNYICMVIDNTIVSRNILDKIFWYKADTNHHLKFKKACNTIGEWFLDCKYNPKYKYCRDRLEAEFNDLYED